MAGERTLPGPVRDKLQAQLDRLTYLWGTGPVSLEYGQWLDKTLYLLKGAFGADSPEVIEFIEAVGEEGSSAGPRNPLFGPWGLWERMRSAEAVLRRLLKA